MLIVILIVLCAVMWGGIVILYFRQPITEWFDNKFGPERREPRKTPAKKQFWRLYD